MIYVLIVVAVLLFFLSPNICMLFHKKWFVWKEDHELMMRLSLTHFTEWKDENFNRSPKGYYPKPKSIYWDVLKAKNFEKQTIYQMDDLVNLFLNIK